MDLLPSADEIVRKSRKIIDNSFNSGIIASLRIASVRNRNSRLTSRWVVKCLLQRVAVVPTRPSKAHIEM